MDSLEKLYGDHYNLLNELGVIKKIEELSSNNRRLSTIIEISKSLNEKDNLNSIFSSIVNGCFENIPLTFLGIVYLSHNNEKFVTKLYKADQELEEAGEKIKFGKTDPLIKAISQHNLALNYNDLKNRHKNLDLENNPLTFIQPHIILPMRTKDFFTGFFIFGNKENDLPFSLNEIEFLNVLASIASIAIENSRLQKMMIRDGKTLLYTYDYFMRELKLEFQKASRYNLPLSLVMADIDFFKKINDEYGHLYGDKVLRYFAHIFQDELREVDTAARFGGEEIAAILPMTDSKGAFIAVERIRMKLMKKTFTKKEQTFKMTVSFGVSSLDKRNIDNVDDFIDLADRALYHAKQYGRNRVVLAEDI